jgi:predicted AlkP superfamily pyrophosphatase or phosphodiesterase
MKHFFLYTISALFLLNCKAQNTSTDNPSSNERPKLIVGIVVDQMRYDYLTRFESKFGDNGFKRLITQGFNCKNNHFNYVPTYTGPGHASVFTGTTPKYHGIISNNWYDKEIKRTVYCAGDYTVESVGTESTAGKMSPSRMLTTTFADENRLFTQMRGKTIGVAIFIVKIYQNGLKISIHRVQLSLT